MYDIRKTNTKYKFLIASGKNIKHIMHMETTYNKDRQTYTQQQ